MGEEGIPVLIETLDMFDWFMNDGFPEAVILDQNMMVYDLPSDYEPNYLNNQIQAALDNCTECNSGGLSGDLNGDWAINVLDVVLLVGCILNEDCDQFGNIGDINGDGVYNVLDIVALVNIVLEG